jgi:hypothetical protein
MMKNKFFISTDRKVVINLEEIAAINEDTKNADYIVYLAARAQGYVLISQKIMTELLEAIAVYSQGE